MDLDLIKFAYKHKLYCHTGNKPTDINSEYFWLYREYEMFLHIEKRSDKSIEECNSTMDFFLKKEFVSEGSGSEYLLKKVYPNLRRWNDIHIDIDNIPKNLLIETLELISKQTIWYYYYDENNKLQSDYKPLNDNDNSR